MPSVKINSVIYTNLQKGPNNYVGRHGKKASENKKLIGVKTGVKQLNKAKTSPPSLKKSTEVNITKLTPAEKQ